MKKYLLLTAALTALPTALAQSRITAQSIIVNPVETDLNVKVWTDRDPSGTRLPNYVSGERITISTQTNRDAYVYLFNVDSTGSVDLIVPNQVSGGNFVKANTVLNFPGANDRFTFTVDGPAGLNKVLALASTTELNLEQLATFKSQQQFATVEVKGQERLAQALSIVVNPLPSNTWTSASASYTVSERATVTTGGLAVSSATPGSVVILNGQTLGPANMTYNNLRPGTYPVRVKASGYADFTTTVTVRAGQTTPLNVELVRSVAQAPVTTGNPLIDLLRGLLGGSATVTVNPVRSAYDAQISDLKNDGYSLVSQSAISGGYRAVMRRGGEELTLNVTQGNGRVVNVKIERTASYTY